MGQILKQMSQTLPFNSNNLQEWGHIHQRLNFPHEIGSPSSSNFKWSNLGPLEKSFNNDA